VKSALPQFILPLVTQAWRHEKRHPSATLDHATADLDGDARFTHADFVGDHDPVVHDPPGDCAQTCTLPGIQPRGVLPFLSRQLLLSVSMLLKTLRNCVPPLKCLPHVDSPMGLKPPKCQAVSTHFRAASYRNPSGVSALCAKSGRNGGCHKGLSGLSPN